MNKYCESCGAPLDENARFCTLCGAKTALWKETAVSSEESPMNHPSVEQTTYQPSEQSAYQASEQPTYQPSEQSAYQASEQPTYQPPEQPTYQTSSQQSGYQPPQQSAYQARRNDKGFEPFVPPQGAHIPRGKSGWMIPLIVLNVLCAVGIFVASIGFFGSMLMAIGTGRNAFYPEATNDFTWTFMSDAELEDWLENQTEDEINRFFDEMSNEEFDAWLERFPSVNP